MSSTPLHQCVCTCQTTPPKAKDLVQGESYVEWWKSYLAVVAGVASFGAGIVFALAISDLRNPDGSSSGNTEPVRKARYDSEEVRSFLAYAWVAFVGLLALASFMSVAIAFWSETIAAGWWKRHWRWLLHIVSLLTNLLLTAAFVLLSLVVVAYVEKPGWISVAFAACFGLGSIGSCVAVTIVQIWEGWTGKRWATRSRRT